MIWPSAGVPLLMSVTASDRLALSMTGPVTTLVADAVVLLSVSVVLATTRMVEPSSDSWTT